MTNTEPGLSEWGWDAHFAALYDQRSPEAHVAPARVIGQHRDRWIVRSGTECRESRIARSSFAGPHPVTGDWVLVEPGPQPADPLSIVGVLPRRTAISRGAAGGGANEHVLAANVDVVWIVHGLDTPSNARRLERYLTAAWESGAVPEVVLTKADLADAVGDRVAEVERAAIGVPIHLVSARDEERLVALRERLQAGRTYALLGPSGAGKSTLINALADMNVAVTAEVRESDRKGRHTTTRRELFRLRGGALLMDTPGLRELKVWSADEGLAHTFPEIEELALSCRFRDCRHGSEPGCAVLAAAEDGSLAPDRLGSYRKLRAETAYLERRDDPDVNAAAVAKHKTALKTMKYHLKRRDM